MYPNVFLGRVIICFSVGRGDVLLKQSCASCDLQKSAAGISKKSSSQPWTVTCWLTPETCQVGLSNVTVLECNREIESVLGFLLIFCDIVSQIGRGLWE